MLVCDLGFSTLQWVYKGKRGRIVSASRRTGGKLVVGEKALLSASPGYLKTVEELIYFYPWFVEEAAVKAKAPKGTQLTIGLPYGMWQSQKNKAGGEIAKLQKALTLSGWRDVRILPQGLGGLRVFLNQNPNAAGKILGIDIGFNTVIFCLLDAATRSIILGHTFYKKGVFQAAEELMPAIQELAPSRTFTPVEISRVIESGELQYGLERYNLRVRIKAVMDQYLEDVLRDIHGELKAHIGTNAGFDTVVVFGGGARLLGGALTSNRIPVVVLRDPEYANAEGFAL